MTTIIPDLKKQGSADKNSTSLFGMNEDAFSGKHNQKMIILIDSTNIYGGETLVSRSAHKPIYQNFDSELK